MSIADSLESTAQQLAHSRRDDAEHARLVRTIRRRHQPRTPRRSAASVLRQIADRIEPESPCLDC